MKRGLYSIVNGFNKIDLIIHIVAALYNRV